MRQEPGLDPNGNRLHDAAKVKRRYLAEVDIFQDVSASEMAEIGRDLRMAHVPRGRLVYEPDQTGEALFVLKLGRVQIYRLSPEGKRFVVGDIEPGTFFGEMASVGQSMSGSFAETLEDSMICVMSRHDLDRLLRSYPQIALRFLQVLAERLNAAEAELEGLALKSLAARLATQILRFTQGGAEPMCGLTHNNLAERVGTSRETATKVLNELSAAGLIKIGRKRIEVLEPAGLEHVAESY